MGNLLIEKAKISELKVGDKVLFNSKEFKIKSIEALFKLDIELFENDNVNVINKVRYNNDEDIYRIIN